MTNLNRTGPRNSSKLAIHELGKIIITDIVKLVYCEADNNYTRLYLKDYNVLVSRTLKDIETLLPKMSFIRIHKSYLVNICHVRMIIRKVNNHFLVVEPNTELPISRRRKATVVKIISKQLLQI